MTHIFIVNPFAGSGVFADELRAQLEEIPRLNYYIFSTRFRGEEEKLVKRVLEIFEGEDLRIYACGGGGTLHHVLNGFQSFDNIQIAFYPCGTYNDLLACFGNDADKFKDIRELIAGDVIDVDYMQTNHGVALNSFSVGLDGNIINNYRLMNLSSVNGKKMGILWSVIASILSYRPTDLDIRVDGLHIQDMCAELILYNGATLTRFFGLGEHTNITDGKGLFCAMPPVKKGKLLRLFRFFHAGNQDEVNKLCKIVPTTKMTVRSRLNIPLQVNMDGELYQNDTFWEVVFVQKGLHLVVPKGVRSCT